MRDDNERDHVTLTEACHQMRVGYSKGRDMVLRGEIEGKKYNDLWVVSKVSVARYLANREQA